MYNTQIHSLFLKSISRTLAATLSTKQYIKADKLKKKEPQIWISGEVLYHNVMAVPLSCHLIVKPTNWLALSHTQSSH
jgi:hypothetical protein